MDRFRFQNAELQQALRRLYEAAGVPCEHSDDGSLVCDDAWAAVAESLRSAVRGRRFPEWRVWCVAESPGGRDCREDVIAYLIERRIPFEMEEHCGTCWLLLPEDAPLPGPAGPGGAPVPVSPPCCFCSEAIEGEVFGEISVRLPGGAFRSVLYAHLPCLRQRVLPEAIHVLEAPA